MPKKEVPPLYPEPQPVYAAPPMFQRPFPIPQPPMVRPPTRVEPYQNTSARLLQDRNATVAEVSVNQSSSYDFGAELDFMFKATGSAKRERGDKFNARTGELLALSRAYLNLSRKLYAAGRDLVEPEPVPEYVPEDNFIGIGAYAAEPDELPLQDPTDEDVALAKEILEARANYTLAVAEALEDDEDDDEVQDADPRVVKAVEAFNGAADALNNAVTFLKALTD